MKCLLSYSLLWVFAASAGARPEIEPVHTKQPVLVMQAEVTVDGEERPDLGRSFTDTLTGGLLKTGSFTVIDYLSNEDVANELAQGIPARAPEQNAGRFGELTGADVVYVPRLIVEDGFNKMSVKKIRVSDGEILAVYEADASGDRAQMFSLAGSVISDIYGELARERAKRLAADRKIRKSTKDVDLDDLEPKDESNPRSIEERKPVKVPDALSSTKPKPKPPVKRAPAKKPSPVEKSTTVVKNGGTPPEGKEEPAKKPDFRSEYAGVVTAINRDWRFCILSVAKGVKLEVGEEIRVRVNDPLQPVAKLKVVKLEGRQVIADLTHNTEAKLLMPGQRAYHWASIPEDE